MSRKFYAEYGPFYRSVTIVFLSFLASMIVLAGAEWAARSRPDPANDRARQAGTFKTNKDV